MSIKKEKEEFLSCLNANLPLFGITSKDNLVAISGGGGAAKTGIKNQIIIFEVNSESKFIKKVEFDTGLVAATCISFHPKQNLLAAVLSKEIHFYKINNSFEFNLKDKLDTNSEINYCNFENYDGPNFLTCSEDSSIKLWQYPGLKVDKNFFNDECKLGALEAIIHNQSKRIFGVYRDSKIRIWSITENKINKIINVVNPNFKLRGCKFLNSMNCIISCEWTVKQPSYISKWDSEGKLIANRKVCKESCTGFAVSKDEKLCAIGSNTGNIYIINLSNMKTIVENKAHSWLITNMCFSNDSKSLISISADHSCSIISTKPQQSKFLLYLLIIAFIIAILSIFIKF
eukprot:TRINITY_DN2386_c0_g2_i1.p1 TRINITY_DN2386_c0_g2~~TRINITY_DN2386_c0_g2_i1.p1  ORF type:complete len:344 (-),score=107.01 TRINITY_DN2386_c0_g2_i1:113-1144(-)